MSFPVDFELTGQRPLLMHHDNIQGSDELKAWRQDPRNKNQSVAGDDRSPAWTWASYLYHDGEAVCMPQENLMAALMFGGSQIILQKQKTFKQLSQSGMVCQQEYLRFEYSADGAEYKQLKVKDLKFIDKLPFAEQAERVAGMGFRLFMKRASVGTSKHVRVRPRFEHWRVTGSLMVLSQDITMDRLEQIFMHAGLAGLGDWRPSSPKRPGPYGMFTATLRKS